MRTYCVVFSVIILIIISCYEICSDHKKCVVHDYSFVEKITRRFLHFVQGFYLSHTKWILCWSETSIKSKRATTQIDWRCCCQLYLLCSASWMRKLNEELVHLLPIQLWSFILFFDCFSLHERWWICDWNLMSHSTQNLILHRFRWCYGTLQSRTKKILLFTAEIILLTWCERPFG